MAVIWASSRLSHCANPLTALLIHGGVSAGVSHRQDLTAARSSGSARAASIIRTPPRTPRLTPSPDRRPLTSSGRAARCFRSAACHESAQEAASPRSHDVAVVEDDGEKFSIAHVRQCLARQCRPDQRRPHAEGELFVGQELPARSPAAGDGPGTGRHTRPVCATPWHQPGPAWPSSAAAVPGRTPRSRGTA